MSSLNDAMAIARSAILTHQKRLAVISHNIANVNTDGYHRQRLILGTAPALPPSLREARTYDVGGGVTALDIVSTFNEMQETLLRQQLSSMSFNSQKSGALADLEGLLAGSGVGSLSSQFQVFWDAWQDVATNPDTLAFRNVLIERGAALTDQIRSLDTNLSDYRAQIASGAAAPFDGIVAAQVADVNSLTMNLQDLNRQISYNQSSFNANSLMDRRTQLIRELAETVDISVAPDYTITLDGEILVSADGTTRNDLVITTVSNAVAPAIRYTVNGSPVNITGGTLGAWTDTVDVADSMRASLDTLVAELMTAVNNIHDSTLGNAYDLNGALSALPFFTGTDASDIVVNVAIHDASNPLNDNPRIIAAADSPSPGNGVKALEIADLAIFKVGGLGGATFIEYFQNQLGALGAQIQSEADMAANGEAIVNMLTNAIQAESGVNLDEEMIDLVSTQRAYEAAAKLFTVIDGMMDVIINRMGR